MFNVRNLSPKGAESPGAADADGDGSKIPADAFDDLPDDDETANDSNDSGDDQGADDTDDTDDNSDDDQGGDAGDDDQDDDQQDDDSDDNAGDDTDDDNQQDDDADDAKGKGKKGAGKAAASAAADADADADDQSESSWIKVGEALGIKVEADDFDEFKEKVTAKLNSNKFDVSKYTPRQQAIIKAFDEGVAAEDILVPTAGYDKILSLGDEQIIRKNLELNKYTKVEIEDELKALREEGNIKREARKLRKNVEAAREAHIDSETARITNEKMAAKATAQKAIAEENKAILAAIDEYEEYNGVKLTPKQKTEIKQKWVKGEYRERFSKDAKFVAKSIMSIEFGSKAVKKAAEKAGKNGADDAKDGLRKKYHNLETLPKNRGGKVALSEKDTAGMSYEEAWGSINKQDE